MAEELKQKAEEYLINHFCKKVDEEYEYMIEECNSGERIRCIAFEERKELLIEFVTEATEELQEKFNKRLKRHCNTIHSLVDELERKQNAEKENAELKCECGRCVYTDSPCILSDYGKDKNGICNHFKNVFDEVAELKNRNQELLKSCEGATMMYKDLQKAKEIIRELLSFC